MKFFSFNFFFLIIFHSSYINSNQLKNDFQNNLISIQQKTVITHQELQVLNDRIRSLNLEIKKNEQSQLIFRKFIEDEENLAEGIILLLQENYYKSPFQKFLQNFEKNSNYISSRFLTENFLQLIKTDVNFYLSSLDEIKSLEDELDEKFLKVNIEKKKLQKKKEKLNKSLRKITQLQKKNPKNENFTKKEIYFKKNAKNINELFVGLASKKKNSQSNKRENRKIRFPVKGTIISKFGEIKNSFPLKNGLMFELDEDQYVISPISGTVKFAGEFMNYGNLIIIENSDFYHSILMGMDEIITLSGSKVLKGQPIGRNNDKAIKDKKKIYFELRYKGKSIDPKREVEIL